MNKRAAVWPRVMAGMMGMLSAGIMFSWSYFKAPLLDIYTDWNQTMCAMIFTVHNFATGIAMVLGGAIIKRSPARVCLIVGSGLVGAGLMMMSVLPADSHSAYVMSLISYGVISGIGVGLTGPTVLNTCARWAPEKMGMIDGMVLFVFSSCPLLYGAIAGVIIPKIGIFSSFRVFAISTWALMLAALPLFRHPKASDNVPLPPPRAENPTVREYTTPQALKTASFWGIFIFCLFMRTSGLIFAGNAATIASAFGAAAILGMIYSPANGSASLVCGFLIDKLGFRRTMPIFVCLQILACVLLFIGGISYSTLLILIGLVMGGFAYGGTTAIASSGTRLLFGTKNYSSTYAIVSVCVLIASVLSSIGGVVVDKTNGDYTKLFILCALLGVLALVGTVFTLADLKKNIERAEKELQKSKAKPPTS